MLKEYHMSAVFPNISMITNVILIIQLKNKTLI